MHAHGEAIQRTQYSYRSAQTCFRKFSMHPRKDHASLFGWKPPEE